MKEETKLIHPADLNIYGRVLHTDSSVVFDWPGIVIEGDMFGNSLKAEIRGHAFWDLYIDGQLTKHFETHRGKQTISLIAPSSITSQPIAANKQFQLIKVSETQVNEVEVLGFTTDGTLFPINRDSQYKIEFIGDSYTVGFGNMSDIVEPPDSIAEDLVFSSTNSRNSFTSIIGQKLNADYQINAFSGKGISRNYEGNYPGKELPYFYDQTLMSRRNLRGEQTPWDFTSWSPDLIVIGLGLNDLSGDTIPDTEHFLSEYRKFLSFLRETHPAARFILCASPSWPKDILIPLVQRLVQEQKEQGYQDIEFFQYTPERTGVFWHPSAAAHRKTAEELLPLVKEMLSRP